MQIGMVGLGRMGANMVRRLLRGGHQCVVYDRDPAPVAELAKEGAAGAASLDELVQKLSSPRTVWLMLPAGDVTEHTVAETLVLQNRDAANKQGCDDEKHQGHSHFGYDQKVAHALRGTAGAAGAASLL